MLSVVVILTCVAVVEIVAAIFLYRSLRGVSKAQDHLLVLQEQASKAYLEAAELYDEAGRLRQP